MKNNWKPLWWVAMIGLCGAGWVYAAGGSNPDAGKSINIEADRARMDDAKKQAIYEGRVEISQGSMHINAARVEAQQDGAGFTTMLATGDQAHFTRKETTGQWVEGWARRVDYDSRAELVVLTDQAHLRRGEDDVRGNVITYNMKTQVYQASSSGKPGGRVRAVIQPKPEADSR